jgi:zinc D-Ala-D-Ala carboxypeptidase
VLDDLGIQLHVFSNRELILHGEAARLVPVGLGTDGRDKMLAPAAARAWAAMRSHARQDGVELLLVSAFRSVEFQAKLIGDKLRRGQTLEQILAVNAPPGYSEHHTGAAIDIGFEDCPALDEAFERTPAFEWLQRRAREFGFSMSYPRGNREGFVYEPWHWRHRAPG